MKYLAYSFLAAALLAPAPLLAQDPAPTPSSSAATPSSSADRKTVTGCIAAGVDGRTFTFTESATSATANPATPAATPSTWTLMANSDVDLSKYIGKKVELTGSPDNKGGMSSDKSDSAKSPSATTGPRFHVKSVRVIAETCS